MTPTRIASLIMAAWVGLLALSACAPEERIGLIASGEPWRMSASAAAGWMKLDFDDASWKEQPPLGEAREYARRGFVVDRPEAIGSLRLSAPAGSTARFYLNGASLDRVVAEPVRCAPERTHSFHAVTLLAGRNVLAAELSDQAPGFDVELVGLPATAAARLVRGPYLQRATPRGVVVRFRTSVPVRATLAFGRTPDAREGSVRGILALDHELELVGLAPDTRYFYEIRAGDEVLGPEELAYHFRTPPVAGATSAVRIWVIGDYGLGNPGAHDVRDAYLRYTAGLPADVWITLGDNAYPNGRDGEFQTGLFDAYPRVLATLPIWPSFGNHDRLSASADAGCGPYFAAFTLPERAEAGGSPSGTEAYYSFDHGNVHLIALDSTESDRTPDSAMLRWLERDLATSRQPWRIAFFHHAPYSKGFHDSDRELAMIEMRKHVLPLLESASVDLVLAGHSHSYERSRLMQGHYGPSASFRPEMVLAGGDGRADGDGPYEKPARGRPRDGTVYVVMGASARLKAKYATYDHPALPFALYELGSLLIDVSESRLSVRFLSDQGRILDAFTIRRR